MQRRNFFTRHSGDRTRHRLRAEARRIDHDTCGNLRRIRSSSLNDQPPCGGSAGNHRRLQSQHRIVPLRVAQQSQHEGVGIDDARRRRKQRLRYGKRRFESARLIAAEPGQIHDAVGLGLLLDGRKISDFAFGRRRQYFAAAPVRYAIFSAKSVKHRLALDAQACLVETGRVVDAGVNDFAVAGTCPRANDPLAFEHDHFVPRARQCACDRKTDDARADHQTFYRIHKAETLRRRAPTNERP